MVNNFLVLKRAVFASSLIILLVVGTFSPVLGAQLNANLNPQSGVATVNYKFLRTVFIEYNDGGEIADLLRNTL